MRAGLYARVSREEQAEGYSLDEQLSAMRRFCADRGWKVAAEYVEPGVSGTIRDRPALLDALRDCRAGKLNVLVTHKLDRLFRNLREMLNTIEDELDRWDVTYVSVVEQIDYSTPHGKLLLNQLGAVAHYFSDNLGAEVRKGKRGRAASGLSNAPIPPIGYRSVGSKQPFEVVPEEAETVRRAFELYGSGLYSYCGLADQLNREGRPAGKGSTSGRWSYWSVSVLLSNPFYAGTVKHTNTATREVALYPGAHEPTISSELWDRVQRSRRRRYREKGRASRKHDHLLQSLLFCCHCGLVLHSEASSNEGAEYGYYRDSAGKKGQSCPVAGRRVRAEVMDDQVEKLVRQLRMPDDWQDRILELANHRQERDQADRQRQQLKAKLRRLRELYIEGDFDRPEYDRRKAELQVQLDALQLPEQPDVIRAGEYLTTLAGLWDKGTVAQRHRLLQGMILKAHVDLVDNRVLCVEPHPEFMVLFRQIEGLEERKDGCYYFRDETEPQG